VPSVFISGEFLTFSPMTAISQFPDYPITKSSRRSRRSSIPLSFRALAERTRRRERNPEDAGHNHAASGNSLETNLDWPAPNSFFLSRGFSSLLKRRIFKAPQARSKGSPAREGWEGGIRIVEPCRGDTEGATPCHTASAKTTST
jgi:hypothetical protein